MGRGGSSVSRVSRGPARRPALATDGASAATRGWHFLSASQVCTKLHESSLESPSHLPPRLASDGSGVGESYITDLITV